MSRLGLIALASCLCLSPLASAQDARPVAPPPAATGQTAPAAAKPATAAPAGKPVAPAAAAAAPAASPAAAGAAPAAPGPRAATPANGAATPPERQTYYLALLRRGPKWIAEGQPGAQVAAKQHEAHVAQLANLGVLALGGTCGEQAEGSDPLVELCVIDAPSLEKARRYVEQDPTVVSGHLRAEFVPWMGPKGLCLKLPATATATAAAAPAATDPGAQTAAKPMQVNPNRPNAPQARPAAPAPAGAAAPGTPAAAPAPASGSPPAAAPAPAPAAGTPKPAPKSKPAAPAPGSVPAPKASPKS